MIYETLIDAIETKLQAVTQIKQVIFGPVTEITKYPAAIFVPDAFENSFSTKADNFEIHRFKLWIVCGTAQKDKTDIFRTTLPTVVDAVKAKLNDEWNLGALDGHRIWAILDTGRWDMSVNERGLEAWAEMQLTVKLSTEI